MGVAGILNASARRPVRGWGWRANLRGWCGVGAGGRAHVGRSRRGSGK